MLNFKSPGKIVVRDQGIKFRVTEQEAQAIRERAASAGMQVSAYLREIAIGGEVKVAKSRISAPSPEAFELRRIGAMLKALYPKDANWSSEEKKRWWNTMSLLIGLAQRIEEGQKGDDAG
jgi:NurA-like 5'-3' nuclease